MYIIVYMVIYYVYIDPKCWNNIHRNIAIYNIIIAKYCYI